MFGDYFYKDAAPNGAGSGATLKERERRRLLTHLSHYKVETKHRGHVTQISALSGRPSDSA